MALVALPPHGLDGIAPRALWRPYPAQEIGEESLHREPSAGLSTGEVSTEERRCSWTELGPESTPAKRCIGFTCSMFRVRSFFPERSRTTRPTSLLLIDEVLSLAEEVVWAGCQPGGGATLLLGLLWQREQRVLYVPGLTVDRSRDTYPGESKTDARDAHVIADQSGMRPGLQELTAGQEELAELEILLSRRRDLVSDKSRSVSRLQRDTFVSLSGPGASPRSESPRPLSPSSLTTRDRLRFAGRAASASPLTLETAVSKAPKSSPTRLWRRPGPQSVTLPAEEIAVALSPSSPKRSSPSKIASRASSRSSRSVFRSFRRLGFSLGLPRDGADPRGGVPGRRRRPFRLRQRRPARRLRRTGSGGPRLRQEGGQPSQDAWRQQGPGKRVFYQSAFASLRSAPESRAFYDRRRLEGKKHDSSLDRPRAGGRVQCSVGDAA